MTESSGANQSPKRGREDDFTPRFIKSSSQVKRLRKAKSQIPTEKDKTRGRYACLGHRMKHKRCPLDCPERRPKPNHEQDASDDSPIVTIVKKEPTMAKLARVARNSSIANNISNPSIVPKKNIALQSEECTIENNSSHQSPMARDSPLSSVSSSSSDRDTANWDSFEWESLSCMPSEHYLKENESWMDLKSSSHWEESKSRDNINSEMDCKPTDDLRKFEEDEIDSWLNEDGFATNGAVQADLSDNSEGNTSENSCIHYSTLNEEVMRILPNIILTRDMLERWLNEPYFNRLVQGCFVRVKVGEYLEDPIFRIVHIDEVEDSWSKGQRNKGLSLQIGVSCKKVFPIAAISNQLPSESDLRYWQEEIEKSNVFLDITEILQKQEIVKVLHIKYPASFHATTQPMVNEPTCH